VKTFVPKPTGKLHVGQEPLDPDDAQLLAEIDGTSTVDELGLMLGFATGRLIATLQRLEQRNLVDLTGMVQGNGAGAATSGHGAAATPTTTPHVTEEVALLEEVVELDSATQERIDRLFAKLQTATHYEMLELTSEADKKAVKRAYFAAASSLHPDRHFRKQLGSFKGKMEMVFSKITDAHDTLSDARKRAAYDEYLALQSTTRSLEARLERGVEEVSAAVASHTAETQAISAALMRANATALVPIQARESTGATGKLPTVTASTPAAPIEMHPAPEPVSIAAKKAALANKLLGGRKLPTSAAATPAPPAITTHDAIDALKRRYEERIVQVRLNRIRAAKLAAEQADASGDPVATLNAYRIAAALADSDPDVRRKLEAAEAKANTTLGEQYRKQAEYEEGASRWEEASRSWRRYTGVLPGNAQGHRRLALALLNLRVDLHQAAAYAQRAIELEAGNVEHHIALGRIYCEAGMVPAARSAADQAVRLAPANPEALALRGRLSPEPSAS
jgi:tetratricopeptide (TPR) repeat protein